MNINDAPPPELYHLFPAEIGNLFAELHRLHEQRECLADRRRELGLGAAGGYDQLTVQAEKADAALIAAAARRGEDFRTLDLPNVRELKRAHDDLQHDVNAWELALHAVSTELALALRASDREIRPSIAAALEVALREYEEFVERLPVVRRRAAELTALVDFLDLVASRPATSRDATATYVVRVDPDLRDHSGLNVIPFSHVVAGLRGEVAAARKLAAIAEPATDPEAPPAPPPHSAGVERWRDYGVAMGMTRDEVDQMVKGELIRRFGVAQAVPA